VVIGSTNRFAEVLDSQPVHFKEVSQRSGCPATANRINVNPPVDEANRPHYSS